MGIMKLSNILWNMEQVGFWIKTLKDKPFQAEAATFLLSPLSLKTLVTLKANSRLQSILSPPVAYES